MISAAQQERLSALAETARSRVGFDRWLELLLALFAIGLILSFEFREASAARMVVLDHDIRDGTILTENDVRAAAVSPLDQSLQSVSAAAGLTVAKAMGAGAPLRWSNVQRLQVTATKAIAVNEVISDANAAKKLTAYDALAITAIPSGKKAAHLIPAAMVLRESMLVPYTAPVRASPPAIHEARKGEVELALHVAGRPRAVPPEAVTLLIARKSAAPLSVAARLLAIDAANPVNVIVAVSPDGASAIVQNGPADIYVVRTGAR
jgi:hypothetical protein